MSIMDVPISYLIEKCRQQQEEYLIKKNEEPVQLSLFKLELDEQEER